MTADEVFHAPTPTAEPRVQDDRARRHHDREALLAYTANKAITRIVQQETSARIAQFARTELHPSNTDPSEWNHDDNAREGWR
jgi:hypothetical protein